MWQFSWVSRVAKVDSRDQGGGRAGLHQRLPPRLGAVDGREGKEGPAGLLQSARVARTHCLVRRRHQGRGGAGLHQRLPPRLKAVALNRE